VDNNQNVTAVETMSDGDDIKDGGETDEFGLVQENLKRNLPKAKTGPRKSEERHRARLEPSADKPVGQARRAQNYRRPEEKQRSKFESNKDLGKDRNFTSQDQRKKGRINQQIEFQDQRHPLTTSNN